MNSEKKERLRLMIKNLESLVRCLKEEIESDDEDLKEYKEIVNYLTDYDEVFEDFED